MEQSEVITLSKDLVYKLIKELKEAYKTLPDTTSFEALKRHNLKIKYKLLESLLNTDSLDNEFEKLQDINNKHRLGMSIKEDKVIKITLWRGLLDSVQGLPAGYSYELIEDDD